MPARPTDPWTPPPGAGQHLHTKLEDRQRKADTGHLAAGCHVCRSQLPRHHHPSPANWHNLVSAQCPVFWSLLHSLQQSQTELLLQLPACISGAWFLFHSLTKPSFTFQTCKEVSCTSSILEPGALRPKEILGGVLPCSHARNFWAGLENLATHNADVQTS